jgi:hypothetical protein
MPAMDDQYLQIWREHARGLGLAEPAIDRWLRLARPQLALHKVTDIEWSGAPDFIASIDCAALPSNLPGFPLPKDGHLLFFHYVEWGGVESQYPEGDGQVLYIPAGTATSERIITANRHPEVEPAERFPLQCSLYWDPTHGCCGPIPDIFDQLTALEDPRPAYVRNMDVEMLVGGYCFTETSGPCDLAEYSDPEHKKWRQLAHMERDLSDHGEPLPFFVRWVIREDDLAEQRFDRVQTHIEDRFA